MEEAGVVFFICLGEELHQVAVDVNAIRGVAQSVFGLDAAIFADAQKDDAVDDKLHGGVDLTLGELGVA
jgi:hypothetical protein